MRIALTAIFCLAIGFAAGWLTSGDRTENLSTPSFGLVIVSDELMLRPADIRSFTTASDGSSFSVELKPATAKAVSEFTERQINERLALVYNDVLDTGRPIIREAIAGDISAGGIVNSEEAQQQALRLARAVAIENQ